MVEDECCEAVLVPVRERLRGTEAVATVEVVDPTGIVTVGKEKLLQLFSNARRMVQTFFTNTENCVKTHWPRGSSQRK